MLSFVFVSKFLLFAVKNKLHIARSDFSSLTKLSNRLHRVHNATFSALNVQVTFWFLYYDHFFYKTVVVICICAYEIKEFNLI